MRSGTLPTPNVLPYQSPVSPVISHPQPVGQGIYIPPIVDPNILPSSITTGTFSLRYCLNFL